MQNLKKFPLTLLVGIVISSMAQAFTPDPALVEHIPEGVTPDERQREWVNELASETIYVGVGYDQKGHIKNLFVSHHHFNAKDHPEEEMLKKRAGVTEETFLLTQHLPALKRLRILKQPLSDDAVIAVLEKQRDLLMFGIENHKGDDTGRFMEAIAGMDSLEWLELKHLFQLNGTAVDKIGHLPSLVRLELDNASAHEEALVFLKENPQILDFELHRSNLTNAQIGEVVKALPKVQRFAIKPNRNAFDAAAMEHVAKLEEIQVLALWSFSNDALFWEDGISHLEDISTLKRIELNGGKQNHPALKRLKQERPEMEIGPGKSIMIEFDDSWMGHT